MLPPFIIDQIRRREEQENEAPQDQPRVEIQVPQRRHVTPQEEEPQRGVVVIDLI